MTIEVLNENIKIETDDTNFELKNLSVEDIDDLMLKLSIIREIKAKNENKSKG